MGLLLILFLPDRRTPGTLTTVLGKYPVQFVEGCAELTVRGYYADRRGLLLTLVGWEPAHLARPARGAERVTFDDAMKALLRELGETVRDRFEVLVMAPGGSLRYHAEVRRPRLGLPLAIGCRYEVRP